MFCRYKKKPVAQLVKNELTGRMDVVWPQPKAPHYAVPNSWNFSRFLSNLIAVDTEKGLLSQMLIDLREQLMAVLPDFGQHLGYDGKAIDSKNGHCSDPDADWGHHEITGVNTKTGHTWKKVKRWFGYGLLLIADTHYEIPVSFHLTPASHSEQVELRAMLDELFDQTPKLAEQCEDFSADRGLDCAGTKAKLGDKYHSAHSLIPANCGDQKNRNLILTLTNRSRVLSTRTELIPLYMPRKVRFTVFA
jgi:hypothetical protein